MGRCRNVGFTDAGWSSSVARWAHNPEVAGSNPAPATKFRRGIQRIPRLKVFLGFDQLRRNSDFCADRAAVDEPVQHRRASESHPHVLPGSVPTEQQLHTHWTQEQPGEPPPLRLAGAPQTGLTSDEVARIAGMATAARAASTRRIYRYAWGGWERWCQRRGIGALPADPAALASYLIERVEAGIAVVSLGPVCSAISYVHDQHGLPNPANDPIVRQVRAGLRRTHGISPRRQARPRAASDPRCDRPRHRPRCPGRSPPAARLRLRPALRRAGCAHPRRPRAQAPRPPAPRPALKDRPGGHRRRGRGRAGRPRRYRPGHRPRQVARPPRHRTRCPFRPPPRRQRVRPTPRPAHHLPDRSCPRPGGRSARSPDHRPLAARRARHRGLGRRRPSRPDRRADPAQGSRRPPQPLHPTRRSTCRHDQP